jgi:periplasmic mercuric ion binding protein
MRTLLVITISLFTLFTKAQQGIKTETISVKGNCEDCQTRIENAADIKGVKVCKWNSDTKVATITYDTNKVSLLQIEQAIAAKGYDAGPVKGNDAAYNKLPKCCQYKDRKHEDSKK